MWTRNLLKAPSFQPWWQWRRFVFVLTGAVVSFSPPFFNVLTHCCPAGERLGPADCCRSACGLKGRKEKVPTLLIQLPPVLFFFPITIPTYLFNLCLSWNSHSFPLSFLFWNDPLPAEEKPNMTEKVKTFFLFGWVLFCVAPLLPIDHMAQWRWWRRRDKWISICLLSLSLNSFLPSSFLFLLYLSTPLVHPSK